MRIIQSYWSKPFEEDQKKGRPFGGWLHKRYHYMSWALSCLKLSQFHDHVELVTDTPGKKELIDQLGLPYTTVRSDLDSIHCYPTYVWVMGKFIAYEIQNKPFLHVDGDVFIWEKLKFGGEDLIVQSKADFCQQDSCR
jgi:hypothetical protein